MIVPRRDKCRSWGEGKRDIHSVQMAKLEHEPELHSQNKQDQEQREPRHKYLDACKPTRTAQSLHVSADFVSASKHQASARARERERMTAK